MSGLPQSAQNLRVPFAEEARLCGRPFVKEKLPAWTTAHETNGAPLVLRHIAQWHSDTCKGALLIR